MKAMVYTQYGSPDVFRLQEIEKPSPGANEILVKVVATSVNYGDVVARDFGNLSARQFNMPALLMFLARFEFGFFKPKKLVLGSEFSGTVEAVGEGVTLFKPGDAVFGHRGPAMGAYAAYLCMPEDGAVAQKPENMSFVETAVMPYGAITAFSLLQKMKVQAGQKILINGASGSIGAAAVQIARALGAEVTGVCSTRNVPLVRSLGAVRVIDYTKEDFTRLDERYDMILDVLGRSSFAACRRVLGENGRYYLASFKLKPLLQMAWTAWVGKQKVVCLLSSESRESLLEVKKLMEAGKLKAVVDKTFPLEQLAEAHRYVENKRHQGQVAVQIVNPV